MEVRRMAAIIVVKDLVKRYSEDVLAVDGISFTVEEGETFGFLGPNGAGKSTTINMLTTLLNVTSGEALIAGYDIVKQQENVRKIIGLVPQDLAVDDELTGRENLQFQADLYEMPRDDAKSKIEELLKIVDLGEVADRMVKTYSGGMRKRLELAEGLIHRPRLLFLDEPTLGLDIQTRSAIWNYINQLKVEHNITVFVTTHYLEEADEQCDRIAIIDHGKIVAIDRPAALKSSIGGDIITILSNERSDLTELIRSVDNVLEVKKEKDQYRIKVVKGEAAIPKILTAITTAGASVTSVSLVKPSLDQAFIEYTGNSMRDAEQSNSFEKGSEVQKARRRA
jgi:ABC-2 type transport system ATP-binding protein